MTHDELLETLNIPQFQNSRTLDTPYAVIRAVVELHKPELDTYTTPLDLDPPEVREWFDCNICGYRWPCSTILAIEKALS